MATKKKIEPAPVNIVDTEKPIDVIVKKEGGKKEVLSVGHGKTLSPTTTEQEDMVSAGQRKINLIWETTQSRIALFVVGVGILINAVLVIVLVFLTEDISVNRLAVVSIALQFINLTTGIVIGFYFSRTNHQSIGGEGKKPVQNYVGR